MHVSETAPPVHMSRGYGAARGAERRVWGRSRRGANMRKACCFTTALPSSSHRACCSSGERLSVDIDAPFSLRIQPGSILAAVPAQPEREFSKSLVILRKKKAMERRGGSAEGRGGQGTAA
jgi:hypothetical protein